MKNKLSFSLSDYKVSRQYLILEEKNVTEVISVVNKPFGKIFRPNMTVGNCGWADEPSKWFVHFDAPLKYWMSIITELNAKGYELTIDKRNPKDIVLSKRSEA